MTFVSLAQATRRLGIDAKTLHRWLADAQLALQSHPVDGRKKGVSQEHLQVPARLHHRHLASSQEEVPAQLSCQITALPADLLSLPEQLSALQIQMVALRQQVADLTRLMTQPAIPAAPTKPPNTAKPAPKPTRATSRPRPAATALAKTPPKPVHVIPHVEYGDLSQGRLAAL